MIQCNNTITILIVIQSHANHPYKRCLVWCRDTIIQNLMLIVDVKRSRSRRIDQPRRPSMWHAAHTKIGSYLFKSVTRFSMVDFDFW